MFYVGDRVRLIKVPEQGCYGINLSIWKEIQGKELQITKVRQETVFENTKMQGLFFENEDNLIQYLCFPATCFGSSLKDKLNALIET